MNRAKLIRQGERLSWQCLTAVLSAILHAHVRDTAALLVWKSKCAALGLFDDFGCFYIISKLILILTDIIKEYCATAIVLKVPTENGCFSVACLIYFWMIKTKRN